MANGAPTMEELVCGHCQGHVGWMFDCGPHGTVLCDTCKELEESEAEGRSDESGDNPNHTRGEGDPCRLN